MRGLSLLLPFLLIVCVLVVCLPAGDVLAGPGGVFAKAAKSRWVQLGLLILAILFLPFILYVVIRERLGIRRTRKDLEALALKNPVFGWRSIEADVRKSIQIVYTAWKKGDLTMAADVVTADFLMTQQEMLDRWAAEGKRNVSQLKRVKGVAPLHLEIDGPDQIGVWIRVTAHVVDYMESTRTQKILKGSKNDDEDFEAIWIFFLVDGEWLLHHIEEGSYSLAFATEKNRINPLALKKLQARTARMPVGSKAAAAHAPEYEESEQVEESEIEIPREDDTEGEDRDVE